MPGSNGEAVSVEIRGQKSSKVEGKKITIKLNQHFCTATFKKIKQLSFSPVLDFFSPFSGKSFRLQFIFFVPVTKVPQKHFREKNGGTETNRVPNFLSRVTKLGFVRSGFETKVGN